MSSNRKLVFSALIVAIYIVIICFTQGFSFGVIQVRIANCLYALAYAYPFLPLPLGVANVIANLLCGGLGLIDIIGGGIVGCVTAWVVGLIGKKRWNVWLVIIPIVVIPACGVSLWLSMILHISYLISFFSIFIGQILPALLGVILVKQITKFKMFDIK